jgi:uncharacterized membrane protein YhhN
MNKKALAVIIIYFISGIAELFFFYGGIRPGLWISQGLLMPLLCTYYLLHVSPWKTYGNIWVIFALTAAWLGDITLMLSPEKPLMMIPGLIGFLFTQIIYIKVFYIVPYRKWMKGTNLLIVLLFITYGMLVYAMLFRSLNSLRLPVLFYTATLITMLVTALGRRGKVNRTSFVLVLTGAVLFVISDSFIAMTLFVKRFWFSELLIGIPYFTAQYLIIRGLLSEKIDFKNNEINI